VRSLVTNTPGSFFTPYCVSALMARMIITGEDIEEARAQSRPFHLIEPAGGAGGMVIAVAEWVQEQGFTLADALFATLIDIDLLCVQMSFVQLCAKGIPAVCVHGDSLGLEEYVCGIHDGRRSPARPSHFGGWEKVHRRGFRSMCRRYSAERSSAVTVRGDLPCRATRAVHVSQRMPESLRSPCRALP
jgi:hypothetical protein